MKRENLERVEESAARKCSGPFSDARTCPVHKADTVEVINGQREVFRMYAEILRRIPIQNAQGWNRYDTDTLHVLHIWADGKSYDINVPKEEYAPRVKAGEFGLIEENHAKS